MQMLCRARREIIAAFCYFNEKLSKWNIDCNRKARKECKLVHCELKCINNVFPAAMRTNLPKDNYSQREDAKVYVTTVL
jgi:hypothetical protein